MMHFISFNGQIIDKKLLNFYLLERFRVADACFESIIFTNGHFPLMELHRKRIYNACNLLGFENYKINTAEVLDLLAKNNALDKQVKLRISLVRANGTNYTPYGEEIAVLIECFEATELFTPIGEVGTYSEMQKPLGNFSNIKSSNALIYVMAKKYALEMQWNDALIQNSNGSWIEASSSNLFIIKENKIYTSDNGSGCVHGIFREYLANLFELNYVSITNEFLETAQEVFLTNAVKLIQPVLTLNKKRLETKQTFAMIEKVKNEWKL